MFVGNLKISFKSEQYKPRQSTITEAMFLYVTSSAVLEHTINVYIDSSKAIMMKVKQ